MPKFTDKKLANYSAKHNILISDLSSTAKQQEFLFNLKLIKICPDNTDVMDRLGQRKHLTDALNTFGNPIGIYKCQHCEYEV